MRKENYFHDFDGPGWPTPAEMKTYFSAERWVSEGGNDSGNDNWTLKVEGLYGTDALPHRDAVNVTLYMTGTPDHGVTLTYDKWDGRIQRKDSYASKGNLRRMREFVRSLHGDLLCIGLFVPFESAWRAVKDFIESDGELPTSIEWIASPDLPPGTFPEA